MPRRTLADIGQNLGIERPAIRSAKLSPDEHCLILSALSQYEIALGMDRDALAGMRNRIQETRDVQKRIQLVSEVRKRLEQFDRLEGITTA